MAEKPSAELIYDIPETVKGRTAIDDELYTQMYTRSVEEPEAFWSEQAESRVDWFEKWDSVRLFCSPLFRCRQTAAVICDTVGANFERLIYDERLKERCFGDWEGLTDREITAQYTDAWAARERDVWNYIISGGGENYPALAARVSEWLDEQPANFRIVLISHGQTGRALRFHYCRLNPEEALNLPVPQNTVFRLFEGRSHPLNPVL